MPIVSRTAFVDYTAADMYALVQDVESYPLFLPWCACARIDASVGEVALVTLEISKGPLRKRFSTRNQMSRNSAIDIELVEGPFERLKGRWRFESLAAHGCKVSLHMDFELASGLLGKTLRPIFNEIAGDMVGAFCRRAKSLYGSR